MKAVLIGTSGFNYSSWRGKFYPHDLPYKEWLSYYSQRFRTVEINNSFYVTVRKETYEKWYRETPPDFSFVIKGHRMITQLKKLHEVEQQVDQFFQNASGLKDKLSCVLWQFPASFKISKGREEEFILRLEEFFRLLPTSIRHAFEFRDMSWFENQDIVSLLKKYNAAFVFADTPKFPCKEIVTADFIYARFHGPSGLYSFSYSDKELSVWADKMKAWGKDHDMYAYFNNDMSGYAIVNARMLEGLVQGRHPAV